MFISYWESALRNLQANRLYSLISIAGLALGLAAFLLLSLFVREETRYDAYHSKADRLYRVTRDILTEGGVLDLRLSTNSPQVAPLLLEDFPEVEQAGRLLPASGWRFAVGDDVYADDRILFADPSIIHMFDFAWLQGDAARALARPDSVVLTQSLARKYFGTEDVLGRTLELEGQLLLSVTGVIEDLPNYTHLAGDMLVSMNVLPALRGESVLNDWSNGNFLTYVLLRPGVDIATLRSGFDDFLSAHLGEAATRARLLAMNIRDIHLHWTGGGLKRTSSVAANFYYFLVALCILLIACFNYTNLFLASSLRRAREVGIRKTMGARRGQLLLQHLGEAVVVVGLATLLALVLVELLLPPLNTFIGESLQFSLWREPVLLLSLAAIVVLVALGSSLYPAFYLSRMQPGRVLAQGPAAGSGKLFSSGLVILQFALAILFVVIAIVMSAQMKALRQGDIGFGMEGLLRISNNFTGNLGERWPEFKRRLVAHPDISVVSGGSAAAFGYLDAGSRVRVNGEEVGGLIPHLMVDEDFFAAYGIQLVAGRLFAADGRDRLSGSTGSIASRSGNYVLGASAARRFGWTAEEAIGQTLESGVNDIFVPGTVVGVVADARFDSVRDAQRPLVYRQVDAANFEGDMRHIVVRFAPGAAADALDFIDATWKELVPDTPIRRRFVVEDFENLYLLEIKLGQLFSFISALTVAIACMGLFGLAAFNTESRTKEIGVRKVVGGSVWNIVVLLTAQFSRLVLVANLLAWPVAWYAMHLWLQQYAEQVPLTPAIFIGSGAIALCIAWVTVGGTAVKAARRRPVLALRYE